MLLRLQNRSIKFAILTLILTIMSSSIFTEKVQASALKRVAILDFINIENDEDFQYLESLITESVQKSLDDKFAFQKLTKNMWQEVAKNNYIFRKDLYTQTASMNLGLLSKQDVVISGGFRKHNIKKSGKLITAIIININILDISKRKVISEIKMTIKVDNNIFSKIDDIAKRIVKEAKSVLPDKSEWAKKGLELTKDLNYYNQLTILSEYEVVALGSTSSEISANSTLSPSSFKNCMTFGLEFQRYGILMNAISVFGNIKYKMARNDIMVTSVNQTVPVSLDSFAGSIGVGYRHFITENFYAQPFIDGGFGMNNIKINYKDSGVEATTGSGSTENIVESSTMNPLLSGGVRVGYHVMSWITLELGGKYNHIFFADGGDKNVSVEFRVGFLL